MPFHRSIKRAIARNMQKTKVSIIVSNLGVAAGTRTDNTIAVASDTTRANYFDNFVKPFSKIQMLNVDLQMYQQGAAVNVDGYIEFSFWKSPGGAVPVGNPSVSGTGLNYVPYTFRIGIAAVPMLTSAGSPSIYHLSGQLKLPRRLQTFAPGDILYFSWYPVGAGATFSVNGRINYMFKV